MDTPQIQPILDQLIDATRLEPIRGYRAAPVLAWELTCTRCGASTRWYASRHDQLEASTWSGQHESAHMTYADFVVWCRAALASSDDNPGTVCWRLLANDRPLFADKVAKPQPGHLRKWLTDLERQWDDA